MLSTTYFLIAISIEQQRMHRLLTEFQQHIQETQSELAEKIQEHYFDSMQTAIKSFYQIEKYWRARKVDAYLIPAILGAKAADPLLVEIDFLKTCSMNLYVDMQEQFEECLDNRMATTLYGAMKQYCDIHETILAKEENELLPLAHQWLPMDAWFSIAAKCLTDQEKSHERARLKVASALLESEQESGTTLPVTALNFAARATGTSSSASM